MGVGLADATDEGWGDAADFGDAEIAGGAGEMAGGADEIASERTRGEGSEAAALSPVPHPTPTPTPTPTRTHNPTHNPNPNPYPNPNPNPNPNPTRNPNPNQVPSALYLPGEVGPDGELMSSPDVVSWA